MGKRAKKSSKRNRHSHHQPRQSSSLPVDHAPTECAEEFLDNLQPMQKHCKSNALDVERRPELKDRDHDGLDFEDPFGDDYEEEHVVNAEDDVMRDEDEEHNEGTKSKEVVSKVWHSKKDGPLKEGETLDFDSTAYSAYYALRVDWPCLSFDILQDSLGNYRSRFPLQFMVAAGTQASPGFDNYVHCWSVENLCCTSRDGTTIMLFRLVTLHFLNVYFSLETGMDEEDEDADNMDEDEGNDGEALIEQRSFVHPTAVNRLRSCPQKPQILATWAESGAVHIWDAQAHIESLNVSSKEMGKATASGKRAADKIDPMFTFKGHATEGFAMDWSSMIAGQLVTGDCQRFIYCWQPHESGFTVDKRPYVGHKASVEDLQWSPTESKVFASCSVDRSLRIWDMRTHKNSMLDVQEAHEKDINVISWNGTVSHLLASGSDDGSFKVWDLRMIRSGEPAGFFKWHEAPITSIEWHPTQESMLAASSEDHSITVWDMSVELDSDATANGAKLDGLDVPPQLLFVHQGQQHIKEIHFHPQIPSLLCSTAMDGFNFFKPANV